MYSIFAMTCLINTQLFTRFKEGLKVKPWYCEDETYPDFVKASFKWGVQHQYNQEYMNAHFDFWFDQVFNNSNIDLSSVKTLGSARSQRFVGHCTPSLITCMVSWSM